MSIPSYLNLKKIQRYLDKYNITDQPAAFEYLVASTFSQIFYLPFRSKNNEDSTLNYRVLWDGKINRQKKAISKSPSGSDAICYAYGFHVLIESTLKEGANQWRREFVQCLHHYDNFVRDNNLNKKDVYSAIVTRKIHEDTYTGFKQKINEGYNIIILEGSSLAKIAEVSILVPTVKHLDLLQLFKDLVEELRESTSFTDFKRNINKSISLWKEKMLKRERTVFFGLKSYEAMKRIGRNTVGISEILLNLHQDGKFNQYTKVLGGELTTYIKEGLLSERLACLVRAPEEDFFCRVNSTDFKEMGLRVIKAVEDI